MSAVVGLESMMSRNCPSEPSDAERMFLQAMSRRRVRALRTYASCRIAEAALLQLGRAWHCGQVARRDLSALKRILGVSRVGFAFGLPYKIVGIG